MASTPKAFSPISRLGALCLTALVCAIGPAHGQGSGSASSGVGADGGERERLMAQGQKIYREGIGGSGEPLKALGAAQSELSGSTVACAACHRRSGYGASEGPFTIRPITAPALFEVQTQVITSPRIKAQLGARQRAPYTAALLARAIRSGVDSGGEPLSPVMPRYALGDEDMNAISAYLSTLSDKPSPGVDDEDIHFATVIQPDVSPEQRRAMLDIMQAFVKDKTSNARSEDRRRDAGTMRMYRAYRRWVLHVWTLKGPSETWSEQLESFYRDQPVFALVGGLGTSSWKPIHAFSERHEIPSIFPQVELPVVEGTNNYNLYFSQGVTLDAEVLAKFLLGREGGKPGRLVQVFRNDAAGLTASAAFRRALGGQVVLDDLVLSGDPGDAKLQKALGGKSDGWVLWLDAKDAKGVFSAGATPAGPVYLSQSVLGEPLSPEARTWSPDVRLIYPSDLPPRHAARLLRTKIWLHNKNIPITDEAIQINTQFAMTILSDALGHIMDSFSRDYMVELVEHIVPLTPSPSMYPSVSLAPGQRFAAKGRSVVQLVADPKAPLKALSGWIVP
ncbi:c-type cytochrome [Hydrogenophaga sp. PAMC20947]|uniref:c-type cytochrome n=1 Tax=Hydrogenophaga sp. PAMC20947 TaxID=2565558 RepID=UPI00109DC6A9|nr:c-type cytochrome [Hydrogenophaga sp. PAMC20947]QCB45689.1 c-type cytochrome [Hydrogenophaga sp. PAMC20947]